MATIHALKERVGRRVGAPAEPEFLPATLEILETPPSPTCRALVGTLIVAAVAGLASLYLLSVDVVVASHGRLGTAAGSATVATADGGVVRRVDVREGDHVDQGQVLVELDATDVEAELARAKDAEGIARAAVFRLEAELSGASRIDPVAGVTAPDVELQRSLLEARVAGRAAELGAIDVAQEQREADVAAAEIAVSSQESSLAFSRDRAAVESSLARKGSVAPLQARAYVESKIKAEHDRAKAERDLERLRAAAKLGSVEKERFEASDRINILRELAVYREKMDDAVRDIKKLQGQRERLVVRAPVRGTVQGLQIHLPGEVVRSGQILLAIIPQYQDWEFQGWVDNKDISLLYNGQQTIIKLDAFDWTRYGVLRGIVVQISSESANSDTAIPDSLPRISSDDNSKFSVRIRIDQASRDGPEWHRGLRPGMSGVAEFVVDRRRLIDLLLAPLRRNVEEAIGRY